MKKTLVWLLVLMMALSLCACGGGDGEGAEGQPVSLSMATGGTSGTYYGFCSVVANVLNDKVGSEMNLTAQSTGASKANIDLVDTGANQLAIVQNDVMYYAYTATDMYDGSEPITSYSAVMSCYPEYVQIIAQENITSIADLKGKKVSVGDAGSGVEFNARQILAAYGIDIDTDINKNNQSFADSADSLKNGTIDAAFVVAGYPTTAVSELASTYSFNLLSVDQEHADALQSQYGFYTYGVIPGGTYSCVAEDTPAMAVMATLIARNDVPEDTIYAFVKGIFDNQDTITAGHVKGAELSLEGALSGIDIPVHPGAQKYFDEMSAGGAADTDAEAEDLEAENEEAVG